MRCAGVGPTPCDWMIVAECPGWQEALKGVPLVGKTGDEVNYYLDGDGLPERQDIFLDNLYREFVFQGYEYTRADLARDEPELITNLSLVRPQVIITLGRHSTRWFLGNVDLEAVQGLPWCLPRSFPHYPWALVPAAQEVYVFPITHPAAGFHTPEIQGLVASG